MGVISRYNRDQFASSAVGIPQEDQSGEIIAEGVGKFGSAMVERQVTIDKAKTTTQAFAFMQQDMLLQAKLRKDYAQEPEKMQEAYFQQSSKLATSFRDKVPSYLQSNFDASMQQYQYEAAKKNITWMTNQQAANVLSEVNSFNAGFVDSAAMASNSQQVMDLLSARRTGHIAYDKLLTPKSIDQSHKQTEKQMIEGYLETQASPDDGNPVKLKAELQDPKFKATAESILGASKFQRLDSRLNNYVDKFINKQAFDTYSKLSGVAAELPNRFITNPQVTDVADSLKLQQAADDKLRIYQQAGIPENKSYLESLKKEKEYADLLVDLAINRSDIDFKQTAEGSKIQSDLEVEGVALRVFAGEKGKKLKAKYAEDIAKQGKSVSDAPWFARLLAPPIIQIAAIAGEAKGQTVVAKGDKANFVRETLDYQTRLLKARNEKQISNRTFGVLTKAIHSEVGVAIAYDKLVGSPSKDPFVLGYNKIDNFARNTMNNTKNFSEKDRDELRSELFTNYLENLLREKEMGTIIDQAIAQSWVDKVTTDWAKSVRPEYAGLKKGDSFEGSDGVTRIFEGWSPNGKMMVRRGKETQKKLNNG